MYRIKNIFLLTIALLPVICVNASELIDLSKHDLSREIATINGPWEFYENKLISSVENVGDPDATVFLPHDINGIAGVNPFGFFSYRATIRLPEGQHENLAIRLNRVKLSFNVFLNGALIANDGVVGINKASYSPSHSPKIIDLNLSDIVDDTFTLVIQTANYDYPIKSGINDPILIGDKDLLTQRRSNFILFQMIVCSSVLTMAVYQLLYWTKRRKDLAALYFSLFCIGVAIRMIIAGEKWILSIFPDISSAMLLSIELVDIGFTVFVLHFYVYHLYKDVFKFPFSTAKPYHYYSFGFISIYMLGWLCLPMVYFSYLFLFVEFYTVSVLLHILLIGIMAVKYREINSYIFIVGIIVMLATSVNDILHERNWVNTRFVLEYGCFFFMLQHIWLMSNRAASSLGEVEQFSSTLEIKVSEATEENRHLLQRITSTIEEDRNKIAKELHDGVNSMIIGIRMGLENLIRDYPWKDVSSVKSDIDSLHQRVFEIYNISSNVVRYLRPEDLYVKGLCFALENLISTFSRDMKSCNVEKSIDPMCDELEDAMALALYRVTQEAMANIMKHANARNIAFILTADRESVCFTIRDDGVGFIKSHNHGGVGIASMHNRINQFGGTLVINTEQGKGTELVLHLPLQISANLDK